MDLSARPRPSEWLVVPSGRRGDRPGARCGVGAPARGEPARVRRSAVVGKASAHQRARYHVMPAIALGPIGVSIQGRVGAEPVATPSLEVGVRGRRRRARLLPSPATCRTRPRSARCPPRDDVVAPPRALRAEVDHTDGGPDAASRIEPEIPEIGRTRRRDDNGRCGGTGCDPAERAADPWGGKAPPKGS
jgi:hypothetical protein